MAKGNTGIGIRTDRETPELPADVLFSDVGIMGLADLAADRRLPPPDSPGTAFILMAVMGGCLNRRKDRPPRQKTIWRGCARLALTATAYERLLRMDRTGMLYKKLHPDDNCA